MASHIALTDRTKALRMRPTESIYEFGILALPAGHVERGETPTMAAVLEMREELEIIFFPNSMIPLGVISESQRHLALTFNGLLARDTGDLRARQMH